MATDNSSPPFTDDSTLNSNFKNQINNWLATSDTATLFKHDRRTSRAPASAWSAGLAASGNVTTPDRRQPECRLHHQGGPARLSEHHPRADLVANTPYPAGADVATATQFSDVMNHALTTAQAGVAQVNGTTQELAGKSST